MHGVVIRHVKWIDLDEEVLQARSMISMITPTWRASCRYFIPGNLPRGTQGSRLVGEGSPDIELDGKSKTWIYTGFGPP
jgi:hypothetical protein